MVCPGSTCHSGLARPTPSCHSGCAAGLLMSFRLHRRVPSCHSGCADRRIPESGALASWPGIPAPRFARAGMTGQGRLRRPTPSCHSGCADRRIPESGAFASWPGIPALGCRLGRNDSVETVAPPGPLMSFRFGPTGALMSFRLRRQAHTGIRRPCLAARDSGTRLPPQPE